MEVLRATRESKGDSKVVYPLLQQNLDKLDNIFADILRNWATAKFSEVEADVVESIAIHNILVISVTAFSNFLWATKQITSKLALQVMKRSITFAEIQQLATEEQTAFIEWYITAEKFVTFVILPPTSTADSELFIWQSTEDDLKNLKERKIPKINHK